MIWKTVANLLEAMDGKTPTVQAKMICKAFEEYNETPTYNPMSYFWEMLALDLKPNNIAEKRATKRLQEMLGVHEEEMETAVYVHDDLAEAVYYLDSGKKTKSVQWFNQQDENGRPIMREYSVGIGNIVFYLNMDCSDAALSKGVINLIDDMSAIERKWFIRYWLRKPRNGISRGNVLKFMAKFYGKKLSDVKKDANHNSIGSITAYYHNGTNPPRNLHYGKFIKPMLAKEAPKSKWPRKYIVDYKYDGNRYQIHKAGLNIMIYNRKGKIVTDQFPDVVEIVKKYSVDTAIFDGEIYPINPDGSPAEHKKMGTRVHSKDVQKAIERVPVAWVMFDCLMWEGEGLMEMPFSRRLEFFEHLPNQAHRMPIQNWNNVLNDAEAIMLFYDEAIRNGFEGIIIKDADLIYEAGKRSKGWVKYKPPTVELDVVVLSVSYGTGNRQNVFGTYEIGVKSEDGFTSIGKVGTGFSDTDLVYLTDKLQKQIVSRKNGVYAVNPVVILEVKSDLVSQDAKGNIGLRFPRMNRIREDKFVEDIDTLETVMEKLK